MFVDLRHLVDLDWDILIVLDACRYDFFAKVYGHFFKGVLKKGLSPATKTAEWAKTVFKGRYDDIIYISANPIINSRVPVWGFNAKEHFHKVIDVWDWGWDYEYGSVPPWEVNSAVFQVLRLLNYSKKRIIIHYMQPHAPYMPMIFVYLFNSALRYSFRLTSPFGLIGINNKNGEKNLKTYTLDTIMKYIHRCLKLIDSLVPKIIPRQSIIWKLRELFDIPPKSPEEAFYRTFSINEIRLLYELNLRFVLKYVNELVRYIHSRDPSKKIIITSDHGELLGERGEIGHDVGWNLPWKYRLKLHEVPWFEVKETLQIPGKWYGHNPHAEKFAKYFEEYEKKVQVRRALTRKIREVRRKITKCRHESSPHS